MCVCVCARARVCMRARMRLCMYVCLCACACACACACLRVCVWARGGVQQNTRHVALVAHDERRGNLQAHVPCKLLFHLLLLLVPLAFSLSFSLCLSLSLFFSFSLSCFLFLFLACSRALSSQIDGVHSIDEALTFIGADFYLMRISDRRSSRKWMTWRWTRVRTKRTRGRGMWWRRGSKDERTRWWGRMGSCDRRARNGC